MEKKGDLRRIVVGNCRGQFAGHFLFPCWGCEGVCDSAYDHHNCPYGILKVELHLLHPSFDPTSAPEISRDRMDSICENVQRQHHLRLALVYPPGYASDIMVWYEYYPLVPIFAVETESKHVVQETSNGELHSRDATEWRQSLRRESRDARHFAHVARNLAKRVAELCQAAYKERTYRRLLEAVGVREGERDNNSGKLTYMFNHCI